MATINRSAINKLLWMGINTIFGMNYKDKPEEWTMVFEKRTSRQAWEEDQLMTGTGYASLIGEGEPIIYDTMKQGWTARFDHDKIGIALRITEEAIDDNLYFKFAAKGGKALARSMKQTCEVRGANILNYATTSGYTGGDGKVLLATDHPLQGGGSYANTLSVQSDLSETALEDLLILCDNAIDDRGLPIHITPKRFVTSNSQRFNIHRLLKSTGRVNTADNDTNALKDMGIFSGDPILLRNLTNTKFWGFTTEGHDGGLICYVRKETAPSTDTDFETDDFKIKYKRRDSFGWVDPRGFYGVDPS